MAGRMDLDDLFGAFEGEEKANDVHEAKHQPGVGVGKRKAPLAAVVEGEGGAGGGANKRSAFTTNENSKTSIVNEGGADLMVIEGKNVLKEGEESSTVREDGTLVKSV